MEARLQRRIQRYGWDRASGDYEAFWSRQIAPAQKQLLAMAELKRGERVIDIACGTGLVSFAAADAVGPEGMVAGTDISEGVIEQARTRAAMRGAANVRFERADAEAAAFRDESFDAALCSLGLMYIPEPVAAVRGMHRVVKPGGRAVVAVWGRRDRCGWAGIFPVVDARVQSEVCPMFFQLGSGDALRSVMMNGGFRDIVVERISTQLHYASAEEAIGAAFIGGPVAMAYSRFDDRTRVEAHGEYLESIAGFRNGEFVLARGES
jgi:ubiquinone/menaquinone biosynthesis C-methylase UbiE